MHNELLISLDKLSNAVILKKNYVTDIFWNDLILFLNTAIGSDNAIYAEREIILNIEDFSQIIRFFSSIVTRHNINCVYENEFARDTIEKIMLDLIELNRGSGAASEHSGDLLTSLNSYGFRRVLKKEQLRDLTKLLSLRHGANFSVPGAGKTSTLLALHTLLKQRGAASALLVVAPRNAFIAWENEVDACIVNPDRVKRLVGGKEKITNILRADPKICLITYQELPYVTDEAILYIKNHKTHLILDESHRVKRGYPGKQYSSVMKISNFAVRRDILSGTPLPQGVSDIIPQFNFLWPGNDIFINFDKAKRNEDPDFINRTIKRLYVRTTKSELKLPPVNIIYKEIDLGPIQKDIYSLLKSESARKLSGMEKEDILKFRTLGKQVIRLLEAASNPCLLTSSTDYQDTLENLPIGSRSWELLSEFSKYEQPAKIRYVRDRVNQHASEDKKVVIWSAFVDNILLLERKLTSDGLNPVTIYGEIETGDENVIGTRENNIRRFHEEKNCMVMIANPAACGEGISLHKACNHAIYLDRTFNAAHFLQSVDRIHRLGLSEDQLTSIEIIISKDTIDAIVKKRLLEKIERMGRVLDDPDLKKLAYEPSDVIEDNFAGLEKDDVDLVLGHLKKGGN